MLALHRGVVSTTQFLLVRKDAPVVGEMDASRRSPYGDAAQRVQAKLEWPVVIAALLTIPILVIQESHAGEPWHALGQVLNWLTWGIWPSS